MSFLLIFGVYECLFGKYKDDPDVLAVCGYSYPVKWDVSEEATI